eukprot:TRINITY_DN636_c0_g1_i3.p1 TRINITY_DN636_c0_g1~~TRINITY_DN636_c0_g1_i3.p1  ORF type:complete len:137 (-),score=37.20 TRINITY_DN636_c0_g1_i3:148-558(-)
MEAGWGGVASMVPSDIALKYINDNVKVQAECDLPVGGHLRNRRIMEAELRGYKQGKQDLLESYNQFYLQKNRLTKDAKPVTCSGVNKSKLTECMKKPGAGLGWTEPRHESSLGLVDIRLHLPGYVGGVKKRDSKFL